jgi:hypothetical protein
LIALQIFGSEWEDKVIYRRVEATDHYVIRKLVVAPLDQCLSLVLGLGQDVVVLLK